MSNVKHPNCKIRNLALEAKARLKTNNYSAKTSVLSAQSQLSPAEQTVLSRMLKVMENGEEIINPIQQLCDREVLNALPANERQRYVFELSNAYVSLKQKMMDKLDASELGA